MYINLHSSLPLQGAGKDPIKLASMPWPVFPGNVVAKVLGSLIDEAIKIDTETLGIFSVPVPKETFPDYYEIIKNPMDYGTFQKSSACVPFPTTTTQCVILSILQEQ